MLANHWQIKAAKHQIGAGGGFDGLDFSSIAVAALKHACEPVNEPGTAGPNILSLIQNVECAVRLHEGLRLLPWVGARFFQSDQCEGLFVLQGTSPTDRCMDHEGR